MRAAAAGFPSCFYTSGEVLDQSMDTCQVEWDTSRERLVGGFEDLKGHFLDVLQTKTAAGWT